MIDIPSGPVLEQIAKFASHPEDTLTADQVKRVLTSYIAIYEGDEVGTVRHNPDTGEIAHRVSQDGVHMWRVTHPDGSQYNDMQGTLDWPTVNV